MISAIGVRMLIMNVTFVTSILFHFFTFIEDNNSIGNLRYSKWFVFSSILSILIIVTKLLPSQSYKWFTVSICSSGVNDLNLWRAFLALQVFNGLHVMHFLYFRYVVCKWCRNLCSRVFYFLFYILYENWYLFALLNLVILVHSMAYN